MHVCNEDLENSFQSWWTSQVKGSVKKKLLRESSRMVEKYVDSWSCEASRYEASGNAEERKWNSSGKWKALISGKMISRSRYPAYNWEGSEAHLVTVGYTSDT